MIHGTSRPMGERCAAACHGLASREEDGHQTMVIVRPAIVFKLLNQIEAHSSISSKLPNLDERCWQELLAKEITPKDIDSARKVAKALHGFKAAGHEGIGDHIILDAEMRQLALESAYSNALYVIPTTIGIQEKLVELERKIEAMETNLPLQLNGDTSHKVHDGMARAAADKAQATADNVHIIYLNNHLPHPYEFLPLKKVTSGSGCHLALAVRPTEVSVESLSEMNKQLEPPLNVGSLPRQNSFKGQIGTYSHLEILKMIIFYNDNFGITHFDLLPVRIDKFRSFLSDFRKQ
ncbi:hypothetical protein EDD85DRAFT_207048 [Armillaria nabsnona]|nr:hypothetical protein EDD85DRAFT_207048 [Armillaria nabsnona]